MKLVLKVNVNPINSNGLWWIIIYRVPLESGFWNFVHCLIYQRYLLVNESLHFCRLRCDLTQQTDNIYNKKLCFVHAFRILSHTMLHSCCERYLIKICVFGEKSDLLFSERACSSKNYAIAWKDTAEKAALICWLFRYSKHVKRAFQYSYESCFVDCCSFCGSQQFNSKRKLGF